MKLWLFVFLNFCFYVPLFITSNIFFMKIKINKKKNPPIFKSIYHQLAQWAKMFSIISLTFIKSHLYFDFFFFKKIVLYVRVFFLLGLTNIRKCTYIESSCFAFVSCNILWLFVILPRSFLSHL